MEIGVARTFQRTLLLCGALLRRRLPQRRLERRSSSSVTRRAAATDDRRARRRGRMESGVAVRRSSSRSPTRGSRPRNGRSCVSCSMAPILYVAVICRDQEPQNILVSQSRRDADLGDTDSFRILLDTFNDGQNAFVFGTNPFGIEYDGQVMAEGQTGQTGGGGAGASFNVNWDAELDRSRADHRTRVGSRVCDSAADAAAQPRAGADVGRQRDAEHPAQERTGLPVTRAARLHLVSRLGGRQAAGAEPAGAP